MAEDGGAGAHGGYGCFAARMRISGSNLESG